MIIIEPSLSHHWQSENITRCLIGVAAWFDSQSGNHPLRGCAQAHQTIGRFVSSVRAHSTRGGEFWQYGHSCQSTLPKALTERHSELVVRVRNAISGAILIVYYGLAFDVSLKSSFLSSNRFAANHSQKCANSALPTQSVALTQKAVIAVIAVICSNVEPILLM